MKNLIREHRLFFILFSLIVLSQVPRVFLVKGFILKAQDYNPVHFAFLFENNDMPPGDDSEVGDNARTLSLSTLNYWSTIVLRKLGMPIETWIAAHMLFVLPLIILGVYFMCFVLFKDKLFSVLGAFLFCVNDFWIFNLNVGYPLLIFFEYYYNDIVYIFPLLSFISLLKEKYQYAALWCVFALLINVTFGINLAVFILIHYLIHGIWKKKDGQQSLLILGVGLLLGFISIKLATPIVNPIPEDIRNFTIQSYHHISPHVMGFEKFAASTFLIMFFLLFSFIFEKKIRKNVFGEHNPVFLKTSISFLVYFICVGVIAYWGLYFMSPELFIIFSPSKAYILASMFIAPYIIYGLYALFKKNKWTALFILLIGGLALLLEGLISGPAVWAFALFNIYLFIELMKKTKRREGEVGNWFLYAGIGICLVSVMLQIVKPYRESNWEQLYSFFDIQKKINRKVETNAKFIIYRLPNLRKNQMSTWGVPFRTYSRRGFLTFWSLGRNVYFNSMIRHESEVKFYRAAGIDVWNEIMTKAEEAKKQGFLYAYLGIKTEPEFEIMPISPLRVIREAPQSAIREKLMKWDYKEVSDYGARIGATHIIIQKDPTSINPGFNVLFENEYFFVAKIV